MLGGNDSRLCVMALISVCKALLHSALHPEMDAVLMAFQALLLCSHPNSPWHNRTHGLASEHVLTDCKILRVRNVHVQRR